MARTPFALSLSFLNFLGSTFKLIAMCQFNFNTTISVMCPALVKLVDNRINTYNFNANCKRKPVFTIDQPFGIPKSIFNPFLCSTPFQDSSLSLRPSNGSLTKFKSIE